MVERGLTEEVVRKYAQLAAAFLATCGDPTELALADLSAATVTDYVVGECRRRSPGSAKSLVTALRSLLGYLFLSGLTEHELAWAVRTVAHWGAGSLPRGLCPEAVSDLLGSCDQSTPAGRRDRAILVLLARLGLPHVRGGASRTRRLRLAERTGRARGKGRSSGPPPSPCRCRRGSGCLPAARSSPRWLPQGVPAGERPARGPECSSDHGGGLSGVWPVGTATGGGAPAPSYARRAPC